MAATYESPFVLLELRQRPWRRIQCFDGYRFLQVGEKFSRASMNARCLSKLFSLVYMN